MAAASVWRWMRCSCSTRRRFRNCLFRAISMQVATTAQYISRGLLVADPDTAKMLAAVASRKTSLSSYLCLDDNMIKAVQVEYLVILHLLLSWSGIEGGAVICLRQITLKTEFLRLLEIPSAGAWVNMLDYCLHRLLRIFGEGRIVEIIFFSRKDFMTE